MLDQIVDVVLKTFYAKNSGLYQHSVMTGRLAQRLVIAGDLTYEFDPQEAHISGLLHDVGKLFLPDLKQQLYGGSLWSPSYYVGTAGNVSADTIRRYIERTEHVTKRR